MNVPLFQSPQVWYKFHRSRTTNIKVIEQILKTYQGTIPRVIDPWPLFRYTLYIRSLSIFIQIFSSIAFIVPEKPVTNFFKNGKIWKPIKGHKYKNYGVLANILPLHIPYLRYQVWYKFHRSRTANINVIEQNVFLNLLRDITPRVMNPWPLFRCHCPCLYKFPAF